MHRPLFSTYESGNWDMMFSMKNKPIQPSKHKPPQGFFHYTTLSAAEKILNLNKECEDKIKNGKYRNINRNDYITLLASHFLFLNDGEELFQGIKEIEEVFKKVEKRRLSPNVKNRIKEYKSIINSLEPNSIENAPNFFILCFCSDGNLLSQWEWYGKDCGIAIEFDLQNCLLENNIIAPDNIAVRPCPASPHKIMYTIKEKESAKKKLLSFSLSEEIDADFFSMLSLITAAHMKHVSFRGEKETRLLLAPLNINGVEPSKSLSLIKYRESNGVIKPYIEIHIKHKKNGEHPIKSVTVGPGYNQHLVYNAIQKLIHTRFATEIESIDKPIPSKDKLYEYTKIGSIEVRRSTIPFRG